MRSKHLNLFTLYVRTYELTIMYFVLSLPAIGRIYGISGWLFILPISKTNPSVIVFMEEKVAISHKLLKEKVKKACLLYTSPSPRD